MAWKGEDVRHWFERAASVPRGARHALLDSHCPDPAVRSEVLSLLEYDAQDAGCDFSESVPRLIRQLVDDDAGEGSGNPLPVRRVGPFELGGLLGSGGMGLVYEARRIDGEVHQRVAVKFAHVPLTTSGSVRAAVHRRFARERQVLASLRHPYIAGLIDAGTTIDGTPYAVIEQVDGVPIDRYCDASMPADADRIKLFLKLCDAVQFAHRNLIVHSDIKPDNVLVTSDGIPKLIDFGVASDLGEGGATQTHSRAFTPEYASPEQLLGSQATVLTDIYGLGAVLYRLLTGARLREAKDTSLSDVIRSAQEDNLVRPSFIRPELKGDLENILLKALQCEPQRRYGSVPELADDLNRFLGGRPVRASPDSPLYRARRFVRRHWLVVGVTTALALALAVTALVATIQRARALRSAEETRRLANRLLFEIHDDIGGMLGGTRAREKLSAIALQYLQSLEGNRGRDPELVWELFNAYARLASSRSGGSSSLGDARTGSQLAAKALKLGEVVEDTSPARERLGRLFDVYEDLASIFHEAGRPAQQRDAIDRMLRLAARLEPQREARALVVLARYLDDNGTESDAAQAYARALSILRTVSGDPVKPFATEASLISTLVGFGRAQALAGEFPGARASLQEAIARSERRVRSHPGVAESARQLYWSHIALGDVLGNPARFSLERPEEAAAQYRKARALAERLVNGDPENEVARMDLARAFSREASTLSEIEPARALALLDSFQSIVSQSHSNGPSASEARLTYLTGSVVPLVRTGNLERARTHISQARHLFAEMQKVGLKPNRSALLRVEAILLYNLKQRRDALTRAQEQLAVLPRTTNRVLSANHEKIKLLERIRSWAAGFDAPVCASANDQLVRIWDELESMHPASAFVNEEARRARALGVGNCASGPSRRSLRLAVSER